MLRRVGIGFGLLLLVVAVLLIYNRDKLIRLNAVNHLFDKENIIQNFQNMDAIFDVSQVNVPKESVPIPKSSQSYHLPDSFIVNSRVSNVADYLEVTATEGLLIIQHDSILYESYHLDLEPGKLHISWSMSKSFVSLLIGMLVDEGKLDLGTEVQEILPQFTGSGYDGVTVKHLLNMSSGVQFNEDYGDFNSDINRFGRAFALGTSLEDFALTLNNDKTPGTYNHYVSIDTQVLGLLIRKITGQSITQLTQERIWEPMGMECPATWIIDNTGMEVVLGGMNACLRDYAKLGLLYLNDGFYNGKQIVSKSWIDASLTPDAPHLKPNTPELSSSLYGYGYQWWLPQYPENDFFATGIYNQFVYVNKDKDLVITKLSADARYRNDKVAIKAGHIDFFQAVAKEF